MSTILSRPEFPSGNVLARSFFEEGIRHLEDAHVLHQAQRYHAAIASAMKAAEFGVKTVIILDGAMGWWDRVFTTHSPLSDMDNRDKPYFQPHIETFTNHSGTLVTEVKLMEKLSPAKPGGSYEIEAQQNPEYPFLSYHYDPTTNSGEFRLSKPSTHFGEADSRRYYNTAQDLLTAVASQYVTIGNWGLTISSPF
jgi:hypothetical protein